MSSMKIFEIAGSALSAQSVRLNTVASNLANTDSIASTPDGAYKARVPVFAAQPLEGEPNVAGVQVTDVVESQKAAIKRYAPGHPQADPQGYIYAPDISPVEEMVNMISAARSYQSSVEILNTSKDLMMRTINFGK